jgi:hypothetical protein
VGISISLPTTGDNIWLEIVCRCSIRNTELGKVLGSFLSTVKRKKEERKEGGKKERRKERKKEGRKADRKKRVSWVIVVMFCQFLPIASKEGSWCSGKNIGL